MNTTPMAMVITPPMRISTCWFSVSALITPNTVAVASTNTTVKPSTNSRAAVATRPRLAFTSAPSSVNSVSAPTTPAR